MSYFSELVLGANTRGLEKGGEVLDVVAKKGERTERATKGVGDSFDKTGGQAQRASGKLANAAREMGSVENLAKAATRALGAAAAAFGGLQIGAASVRQARDFNAALSEVSTLIEGTPAQMEGLRSATRDLVSEFGGSSTSKIEAFYQAISAGAGSVADSAVLLEDANRLAIGGVTDLTTAVDVLTTATNAYAASGLTAAEASDAIFVGVKAGKTTVTELSAALGNVIPIASSLGVTFDEVVGSVAALTTQGQTTSVAVTGLRAILTAVVKPTKEAADAAAELGLQFDVQALRAQGLEKFLQEVIVATGGSEEAMGQLFGSVEALNAVLAFAGGAGEKFSGVMVDLENKTGAATEAYEKMAASLDQRWKRASAAALEIGLRLGDVLLTLIVPALEATAKVLAVVADNADVLAISLGFLAATQIPAVIAGVATLVTWMGTMEAMFIAGAVASRALTVAMNAIPFVAIVTGVTTLYRLVGAYGDAEDAANGMKESSADLMGSLAKLDAVTIAYYRNVTQGSVQAMKAAADLNATQAKNAMAEAQRYLEAQQRIDNLLGLGLLGVDSRRVTAAKEAVEALELALYDAEVMVSVADHAVSNFQFTVSEAKEPVGALALVMGELKTKTYAVIPGLKELSSEYGFNAAAARDLMAAQNEMALFDASAGIDHLLESVKKLGDNLDLGKDKIGALVKDLDRIKELDSFASQAAALQGMAAYIYEVSGGLQNMDAETRSVYQSLITAAGETQNLAAEIALTHANTTALGAAIAKIAPQFAPAISAANTLATAVANVISKLGSLASGLLNLSAVGRSVATATENAAGFLGDTGASALASASSGLAGVAGNLKKVWAEATKADATVVTLGKSLNKIVNPGSGKGGKSGGGATQKLSEEAKAAAKELRAAEKEAQRLEDAINRPLNSAIDGIADAFSKWITGGMKSIKDLGRAILDTVRSSIAQAIAFAISNPIKLALGVGGVGGSAAAGIGGGGGGGGLLGGLGGGGGGLLGGLGGIGTGISNFIGAFGGGSGVLGGISTVGGAFLNGGFASGISSIGSVVSGATAGLGGLGAAIGAVALPLLAVAAVFSFFKKKVKELDTGLRITVDGMDALAESFRTIETKRFWGMSKKVTTSFTDLPEETAAPILKIVSDLQEGVQKAAEALGIGADVFDDFTYQLKVSTKGMSDEEAQEAVAKAFEKMGDAYADMIEGLAEFKQIGEGSSEALNRLATSLTAVNYVVDLLSLRAYDVSLAGADAASAFVDLFGGLEAFNNATGSYYQNFYTSAERTAKATQLLTDQLVALGLEGLPSSRAAFRALVDEADALGDVDLVASLIKLAPAFAEITAASDALANSLASNGLFRTLQDQQFAATSSGYTLPYETLGSDDEDIKELLQEVVRAIREGDINSARISTDTLREIRRSTLNEEMSQ